MGKFEEKVFHATTIMANGASKKALCGNFHYISSHILHAIFKSDR